MTKKQIRWHVLNNIATGQFYHSIEHCTEDEAREALEWAVNQGYVKPGKWTITDKGKAALAANELD